MGGDRERVLIVDDDRLLCQLLATVLREFGYEPECAYTAAAARDILETRPELCICDLMLGTESGLDLAREIADLAPDVALVMMSGSDDVAVVDQALLLGAYDYLLKPFRETQLLIAVRNALRRRRLEHESRTLRDQLQLNLDARTLELELAREETIHRLARAIAFRDTPTGGHVERMAALCGLLAEALGVDGTRVALIRTASLLHDIGKLGVPDRILLKPGPLTDEERSEMQRHTELGHRLLSGSNSKLVDIAATIALTHHERYDGNGYPRGVSHDAIPIEGRIAAVCDVFDALTSARPYRAEPFRVDEALEVLQGERGEAFDPDVVDAFFDSLDDVHAIQRRYAQNGHTKVAA
jgi:putative two-component system response regulator